MRKPKSLRFLIIIKCKNFRNFLPVMKLDIILMMDTYAKEGLIFKILQKVGAWLGKKHRL